MTAGRRAVRSPGPIRWRTVRALLGAVAAVPVAAVVCLLAGVPPLLPALVVVFAALAVFPLPGLAYVLVVLNAPLGLRLAGVEGLVGDAFGGREYALGLSATAIAGVHALRCVLRGGWSRRQVIGVSVGLLVLGVWSLIGVAHHGPGQTLSGLRLTVLPFLLLLALLGLGASGTTRMVTVAAWLLMANGVATVAELIIGPQQLVQWGFEEGQAIRYIGDTFRAPGLTEVNAELGILAGAFLLGYVALWLTSGARPTRLSWHVGAVSAVVCLALSTSRSGALLVVGGVIAAAVGNRSGGAAARRRARLVGLGVVACVTVGFVAVGATGARSLFQRFEVWSGLLDGDLPLWGRGIGAAGAATVSRAASGGQVFVDNYFVSVALQYGLPMMVALIAGIGYLLARLWRYASTRPSAVSHLAVLTGLSAAFLVIEAWEYTGATMCLALFVAYGNHLDPLPPAPVAPAVEVRQAVPPVAYPPVRPPERRRPVDAETVVLPRVEAETAVLPRVEPERTVRQPVDADTVVLPPQRPARRGDGPQRPARRGGDPQRSAPPRQQQPPPPYGPRDDDSTAVLPVTRPDRRHPDDNRRW
ncbi:O-antigen ligase family protein [Micromonospora profundi]|uniref:O-antigen ligase family protein n=1 Tax=Micromonospora TaxID=1873 RepID=UPI0033A1FE47